MTASHYKDIDLDLLLAGAILHDIGKVSELTYERAFGYSTDGQLLGHIMIGMQMLHDKICGVPGFPPKLRILLQHMILSHHGELEFGSPKVPVFPEALLLHHLDNLDSKMECMRAAVAKDRNVEGCWTMYNSPLDRSVLKKLRYMEQHDGARVEKPAVERPAGEKPVVPARPNGTVAQPPPTVAEPAPVHHPEPQRPEPPASIFAEKLQQAWRRD